MKNLPLILMLALFLAGIACQESGDVLDTTAELDVLATANETLDVSSEAAVSSTYEDVDVVTEAGFDFIEEIYSSLGRVSGKGHRRDRAIECATIERDTANNLVTIDFGDGCESKFGVFRSGKIIIQYEGTPREVGFTKTVTLDDFYLDSLYVEGSRSTSLIAYDSLVKSFQTVLTGGKVTFPDSTFVTRDAEHVRTRYRGDSTFHDYSSLIGSASGLTRDGLAYSSVITDTLIYKRGCWSSKVVIPVQGIKEVTVGDTTAIVDYGDGSCDNEVIITIGGVSTTETIEPDGRLGYDTHRGRHKKKGRGH